MGLHFDMVSMILLILLLELYCQTLTNCADDACAAELGRWVVLGVEGREPLNPRSAIFLVHKRVTHDEDVLMW